MRERKTSPVTIRIEPLRTSSGNKNPNQIAIYTEDYVAFQSYGTTVAKKEYGGKVYIDPTVYRYSRTTMKYLCQFLDVESMKDVEKKLKSGEYEFELLN